MLIASMACVIVWQLARDNSAPAAQLRDVLVRLSGRQIKRGKNRPDFTAPALLAGLGVFLPMLYLLEQYEPTQLKQMIKTALPNLLTINESG